MSDQKPYWFDSQALTAERSVDQEMPPTPRTEFREAWSASRSVKERLAAIRSADLKTMASEWWSEPRPLQGFAEVNGLEYTWQTYEPLPGMIFRNGERRDVIAWEGPPVVEFGNFSTMGQELVQAFGYVGVCHQRDLPHLVLDSRANDAEPPRGSGLFAKKSQYSSLTANYRGSDSATPMGSIRREMAPLELGQEAAPRFRGFVERGREDEARAFLSGETLQLMSQLTTVFDVEITREWIFLYGYAIEVSTREPDRWAWIFSVASQLLDGLSLWDPATTAERPAFYTARVVERPASLTNCPSRRQDGVLSGPTASGVEQPRATPLPAQPDRDEETLCSVAMTRARTGSTRHP